MPLFSERRSMLEVQNRALIKTAKQRAERIDELERDVAASVRGDGTNPHTMEFGRLKAYTARTRGQTSLEFKNLTDKPENAFLKQIPNVVAVGGGVPIKVGNEVIGAVGVSGAPGGEKDEACANAGIAKVAASLN